MNRFDRCVGESFRREMRRLMAENRDAFGDSGDGVSAVRKRMRELAGKYITGFGEERGDDEDTVKSLEEFVGASPEELDDFVSGKRRRRKKDGEGEPGGKAVTVVRIISDGGEEGRSEAEKEWLRKMGEALDAGDWYGNNKKGEGRDL